jgi:hypothetical protein
MKLKSELKNKNGIQLRFATMLARRNNNGHLGTISYCPADGILFGICCYLQHYYNRLQLSARHYKMPAQQQADGVMRQL